MQGFGFFVTEQKLGICSNWMSTWSDIDVLGLFQTRWMTKKTSLRTKDNPEADHYSIAPNEMCWEQKVRAKDCK